RPAPPVVQDRGSSCRKARSRPSRWAAHEDDTWENLYRAAGRTRRQGVHRVPLQGLEFGARGKWPVRDAKLQDRGRLPARRGRPRQDPAALSEDDAVLGRLDVPSGRQRLARRASTAEVAAKEENGGRALSAPPEHAAGARTGRPQRGICFPSTIFSSA